MLVRGFSGVHRDATAPQHHNTSTRALGNKILMPTRYICAPITRQLRTTCSNSGTGERRRMPRRTRKLPGNLGATSTLKSIIEPCSRATFIGRSCFAETSIQNHCRPSSVMLGRQKATASLMPAGCCQASFKHNRNHTSTTQARTSLREVDRVWKARDPISAAGWFWEVSSDFKDVLSTMRMTRSVSRLVDDSQSLSQR